MTKSVKIELAKEELLKIVTEASVKNNESNWKWSIVKVDNKKCSFEIKWGYLQDLGSKENFKVSWSEEAETYGMYDEHGELIDIADTPSEAIEAIVYYGMSRY